MNVNLSRQKFVPKHRRVIKKGLSETFDWSAIPKLIAFLVPLLYVIGRVFDGHFLQAYGVSADLFPKGTQDYLFLAMYGIYEAAHSLITAIDEEWLTIFSWALGVSGYVGLLLWIDGISFDSAKRSRVRNFLVGRLARIFGVIGTGPFLLLMAWGICSGIVIVVFVPVFIGAKSGERVATEQIKRDMGVCTQAERTDPSACVVVTRGGQKLAVGRVIDASNSSVAIAVDGKAIVFAKDGLTLEVLK